MRSVSVCAALIGEQRSSGVRLISLLRPNGRSSHQCSSARLESLIGRVSQRASAHAGPPAPVTATFLQGRTFSPTNHPWLIPGQRKAELRPQEQSRFCSKFQALIRREDGRLNERGRRRVPGSHNLTANPARAQEWDFMSFRNGK